MPSATSGASAPIWAWSLIIPVRYFLGIPQINWSTYIVVDWWDYLAVVWAVMPHLEVALAPESCSDRTTTGSTWIDYAQPWWRIIALSTRASATKPVFKIAFNRCKVFSFACFFTSTSLNYFTNNGCTSLACLQFGIISCSYNSNRLQGGRDCYWWRLIENWWLRVITLSLLRYPPAGTNTTGFFGSLDNIKHCCSYYWLAQPIEIVGNYPYSLLRLNHWLLLFDFLSGITGLAPYLWFNQLQPK